MTPDRRDRVVIAYPDGADTPTVDPWTVATLTGLDGDPSAVGVLLGWMPVAPGWVESPELHGLTIMGGYALASAVADGRIRYVPIRLGAVPRLVADVVRPDVAVVSGVRRGAGLAYRGTVGWAPAAVAAAGQVVVEVDDGAVDLGAPMIEGVVDQVVERSHPAADTSPRPPDDTDLAIGRRVAALLPDEPTIQLGPGGIAEAIVTSLERPVAIRSGLLTDAMAGLAGRGLLAGRATAAYVWGERGGEPIASLADEGRLDLVPVRTTHDVGAIASVPRFVGCNTALQVGLDGSVNVERVGGRLVAGIGGHADFCAGATGSAGGLSVIALRSTTRRGDSTIVPTVETVSTPRCDVEVVVTEHGMADLRGVDDGGRARRLAAVAAPEHRDALRER